MTDPVDRLKHVADDIEHPIETAKELEHEAEMGESARTPLIAITGVGLFAGVVVLVVLAIALTVYYIYGG
jgi:hypothetical protein